MSDFISYKNPFVRNSINRENLPIFNDIFTTLNTNHNHNTRARSLLDIPLSQTTHYVVNSIKTKAISSWNTVQRISNINLLTCDLNKFKREIYDIYYANF